MSTISELAEKFEKLLDRLPAAIRTPVQREWQPLNELFIKRRPPRVVVVGKKGDFFLRSTLIPVPVVPFASGLPTTSPEEPHSPWQHYHHVGRVHYALAIDHVHAAKAAIAAAPPDCFVLLLTGDATQDEQSIRLLAELHRADRAKYNDVAPILVIADRPFSRDEVSEMLDESLRPSFAMVLPASSRGPILTAMAKLLPQPARLEFARATGDTAVQKEIAQALVRSTTAVCAAIGTQPIPLADFPVLSSLQVLMIAGIIHISGREWRMSTVREFLGALGLNLGAGLLLREGARAAIKFLPGWGNAISGALAGAGTYGIGLAAITFFVDDHSIKEARKHLRLSFRKKKRQTPPPLPPASQF